MVKWLKLIAGTVLLLSIGAPPAGAADMVSTHPSHYTRPGEALGGSRGSILDRTKQARPGSHVIVRDPDALQGRWMLNAALSRACNQRLFRQKRDQFLVGVVEGHTYGAAVGGHSSLEDRAKMAEDKVVYLFRGQDTTDCRVWHRTQ